MRHGEHHYFVLRTRDLPASSEFFSELLGWDVVGGELRNVASFGALTEHHERAWWVHVDDCDAAAARVARLGGRVHEVTDEPSGRNAICDDDQGNRFHMGTLVPELQDYPHPPPLPHGELGYVTFAVGDTGRAVEFHAALFGWEFSRPGEAGTQAGYRHCTNGALPFGFTAEGEPGPSFYFRVADIEAVAGRVPELGGTAGDLVDGENGRSLIGSTDPAGVPFELWQPAPGL